MGPNISTSSPSKIFHQVARNYFDFLHIIGRGGFGKVWKVQLKRTTKYYALKEMSKLRIIDRKSEHSIVSERDLLASMNHSFIVNMNYAFQDYENLYLVMDLLTGGDLRYQLFKYKQFDEEITRFFIACLILGLEYIHSKQILHRDIKPENLVCDKSGIIDYIIGLLGYVRITDFGVAKVYQKNNAFETSGTPGYMAPEVLFGQNHSYQVDYFAIGVIGYEFMYGLRPYLGRNRKEIRDLILNKQVQIKQRDLRPGWSTESADFINKLLLRKPNQRLGSNGISELKKHPWMKPINWEQLLKHELPSPFIPESTDNFDKKYCEAKEKIGEDTNLRYQEYVKSPDYITLFGKYNFLPKMTFLKKEIKKKITIQPISTSSSIKLSKGPSTRASFNESLTNLLKVDSYNISQPHVQTIYTTKNNQNDQTKAVNNSNIMLGKSISMKSIDKIMRKTISVMHSNNNLLNSLNKHQHIRNKDRNGISYIQLSDQNNLSSSKRGINNNKKQLSPFNTLDIAKSQELSQAKIPINKDKQKDSVSRNRNSHKKTRSLYSIKFNQNLPLLSLSSYSPTFNRENNTVVNKDNVVLTNKKKSKNKNNNNNHNHKVSKNVFKQPQKTIVKPQQLETLQLFQQGHGSGNIIINTNCNSKYNSPLLVGANRNGY